MAKNQAATIKKEPSKFSVWYNSLGGQRTVGAFYSVGASLVIIGALFKIMHWPGAGIVLTVGMVTEAILFFIGVFEKPHKKYNWENIYPQLMVDSDVPVGQISANERLGLGLSGVPAGSLDEKNAESLEGAIKRLTQTAEQIGNISEAAVKSEGFANSLSSASDAVDSFTSKQKSLDEVSENMIKSYQEIAGNLSNVSVGSKQYASHTEAIGSHVSAINSIYELELKNIKAQAETITDQTAKLSTASSNIENLLNMVANTAKEMEVYKQQTEKLAKQVTDLNSVYGNMLNAIRS